MSNELAKYEPSLLRPIAKPSEILAVQAETTALIIETLVDGVDFGVVPGTSKKAGLFKAGAERINKAFGVYADYVTESSEIDHNAEMTFTKRSKVWNNKFRGDKTFTWKEETGTSLGLYRYVVRCELKVRGSNEIVGVGGGVCSTVEAKYVDRPRDCENTVLKMAQKRALVGAVLNTYGLSDRFTQDVEDLQVVEALEAEVVDDKPAATAAPNAKPEPAAKPDKPISPAGQRLLAIMPVEADRRDLKQALAAVKCDWKEFVMSGAEDETREHFLNRAKVLLGALENVGPETEKLEVIEGVIVHPVKGNPASHDLDCLCPECEAKMNANQSEPVTPKGKAA